MPETSVAALAVTGCNVAITEKIAPHMKNFGDKIDFLKIIWHSFTAGLVQSLIIIAKIFRMSLTQSSLAGKNGNVLQNVMKCFPRSKFTHDMIRASSISTLPFDSTNNSKKLL